MSTCECVDRKGGVALHTQSSGMHGYLLLLLLLECVYWCTVCIRGSYPRLWELQPDEKGEFADVVYSHPAKEDIEDDLRNREEPKDRPVHEPPRLRLRIFRLYRLVARVSRIHKAHKHTQQAEEHRQNITKYHITLLLLTHEHTQLPLRTRREDSSRKRAVGTEKPATERAREELFKNQQHTQREGNLNNHPLGATPKHTHSKERKKKRVRVWSACVSVLTEVRTCVNGIGTEGYVYDEYNGVSACKGFGRRSKGETETERENTCVCQGRALCT